MPSSAPNSLIGRQAERETLDKAIQSKQTELVALYGRRRVGKTFLIRQIYAKEICFELTGLHNATMVQQLETSPPRSPESVVAIC